MEGGKKEKTILNFNNVESYFFSGILNTLLTAQTLPIWFHQGVLMAHFAILMPSFYNINVFLERHVEVPLLIQKWGLIIATMGNFPL
jgi:hypothetical protein